VNLRRSYQAILDNPAYGLGQKDMARQGLALCDTVNALRAQALTEHSRDVIADTMSEQQALVAVNELASHALMCHAIERMPTPEERDPPHTYYCPGCAVEKVRARILAGEI
jgi:hypothetical protein